MFGERSRILVAAAESRRDSAAKPGSGKTESRAEESSGLGDGGCAQRTLPLVSFVIPAYRCTSYIRTALESVFRQTIPSYEVIVVNDQCPDTANLEIALEPYRNQIVYIVLPANRGSATARNAGIRAAQGRFIAFLDADDIVEPDYLEKQLAAFDADSSLDLICCDTLLFGRPDVEGLRYSRLTRTEEATLTLEGVLIGRSSPVLSCVVVRRQAVLDIGCFDEAVPRNEDFDLWLRLLHRGKKLVYHPVVLGRRLERGGNKTSDNEGQALGAAFVPGRFADRLPPGHPLAPLVAQRILFMTVCSAHQRARKLLNDGDVPDALIYYRLAAKFYPSWRLSLYAGLLSAAPKLALSIRVLNQLRVRSVSLARDASNLVHRFRKPNHVKTT